MTPTSRRGSIHSSTPPTSPRAAHAEGAATRNGRRRAQSDAGTSHRSLISSAAIHPTRTTEATSDATVDAQLVGRQRSKSVALTSREKEESPRRKFVLDRAKGGATTGAERIADYNETAFFKPNEETLANLPHAVEIAGIPKQNPGLGERSLVTYKIGQALLDSQVPLPLTYIDTIEGKNGAPQEGLVMQKAPGKSAAEIREKRAFDPKKIQPKFVENLLDLQAIDFITGQTDRNLTNIFVQEEGEVLSGLSGIDSDTSFGKNVLSGRSGKPDKFPHDIYLVSETFKKNLEERYDNIVDIINAANLSSAEKEQALFRLDQLKKVAVPAGTNSPNDLDSFIKLGPYFGSIAGHIFKEGGTLNGREKRDYTSATEKKAIEHTTQEFFTRYPDVFIRKHLQKLVQLNNDLKQLEGTDNEGELQKIIEGINNAISIIKTKTEELKMPIDIATIETLNAHELAESDDLGKVIKEINLDSKINLIQGQLIALEERKQIETGEEAERKAIFERFHTIVLPRPSTPEPPLTPPVVAPTPFDLTPEGQRSEATANRRLLRRLQKDIEYARQMEEQDSDDEDTQTPPAISTMATTAVLAKPVVAPTAGDRPQLAPLKEKERRLQTQKTRVTRLSAGSVPSTPSKPGINSTRTVAPGAPNSTLSGNPSGSPVSLPPIQPGLLPKRKQAEIDTLRNM